MLPEKERVGGGLPAPIITFSLLAQDVASEDNGL